MPICAKIYHAERTLKMPFSTASGSLCKKEIIQIVFHVNSTRHFVYELPLSPSLGAMPREIREALLSDKLKAFQVVPHLKRSLTYLQGLLLKPFPSLAKNQPIHSFPLYTCGINKYYQSTETTLIRLKSDLRHLDQLADYCKNLKTSWAVDFNGSLDESGWRHLIQNVNLRNCKWIEQPFPVGQLTKELASCTDVPIYADEEMDLLDPKTFHLSPYKGFILKPIRHDYQSLIEWLFLAQNFKIPCLIGNPVCDTIALSLCQFFNQYSTVQITQKTIVSPFIEKGCSEPILIRNGSNYVTSTRCVNFIEKNYSFFLYIDSVLPRLGVL